MEEGKLIEIVFRDNSILSCRINALPTSQCTGFWVDKDKKRVFVSVAFIKTVTVEE